MIKLGIAGYGNLGKGLVKAISKNNDMEAAVIFTRRDPETLQVDADIPIVRLSDAKQWQDKIDVLVLCGGSATDLPEQGPDLAKLFHTVDSYDTHAKIPEYFAAVDRSARESGHLSLISGGWDPGLFSVMRVLFSSVLPDGQDHTFWGTGVSQGHSDAIRRIPGVVDARQYTVPVQEAQEAARTKQNIDLTTRQKHRRDCYVVAEETADKNAIEQAIVTMPNYFADYDTTVTFISEKVMREKHSRLPHGGSVIRRGRTSKNSGQMMEFNLQLESNPEFTASVLAAYARAVCRLKSEGKTGAVTVFDIPVGALCAEDPAWLRKKLL